MRMKRQNWQLATEQESTWATSYTMSADGGGRDDNEQARAQDQPCHVVLSSQIPPIGTGLFRVKQSRQPTGTTNAVMLPRLPDLSDDLTVDLVSFLNVQETRTLMLVNRRYRSLLQGGNENDQTSALGRTVWKELLRKNEDSKTIMTTVIPGNATGEEGRANQLDVAKRSYLDALTRGRE